MKGTYKWPKKRPVMSADQLNLLHRWNEYWLPIMNNSFGPVHRFNHGFPLRSASPVAKTLEIGIGEGSHARIEQSENYFGVDRDTSLIRERARVAGADVDVGLPFKSSIFDRVLAIHVLEHLANLPHALAEVVRVMKPGGVFSVVIPCEGGIAYTLGRNITSRRIFERKFGKNFDWIMAYDHVNTSWEILSEVRKKFCSVRTVYFPTRVPSVHVNLLIGMELQRPKN
jgi:SAM-dependent methyltransferase